MQINQQEMELLKGSMLNLESARIMAERIDSDYTVNGIFPEGATENYSVVNEEKFKKRFCSWWPVARILLILAKNFTNERGDLVIDALIAVGDRLCV